MDIHHNYSVIAQLLVFFALVISVPATSVTGAEPNPIQALIEQLGSEKRIERAEAETRLKELGEEALGAIESALQTESATSFQLQNIADAIRLDLAKRALTGTRVTIEPQNGTTLGSIAEFISKQTDYDVLVTPELSRLPAPVEIRDQPFWLAIDTLGRAADVGWDHIQTGVQYSPTAQKRFAIADYPQCLRVAAAQPLLPKTFRRRLRSQLVRIGFRVDVEPNITTYFLTVKDKAFSLHSQSDSGERINGPFNPGAVREVAPTSPEAFEFTIDFETENPITTETLNVKGEVELFCSAKTDHLRIALTPSSSEPGKLSIVSLERQESGLKLTIDIIMPKGIEEFDSYRQSMLHQRCWLIDQNSEKIPFEQKRIVTITGAKHRVEFLFSTLSSDVSNWTLAYDCPAVLTHYPISFHIREMPYANENQGR